MSAIQKRILRHLLTGNELSIKNMYFVRISNCSREIRRQIEIPLNIELDRNKIEWKDDLGNGYYFEYRLKEQDNFKAFELLKKLYINKK